MHSDLSWQRRNAFDCASSALPATVPFDFPLRHPTTGTDDDKQSFIDEQNRIGANGGPGGSTYNKINSPGKNYRDGR